MKCDVTEIAAAEDISEGISRWCSWSHKAGVILLHSRGFQLWSGGIYFIYYNLFDGR